jgi:hypothetical protein
MSEPTPQPAGYPRAREVSRTRTACWIAPLALVVSLLAAGAAGWAAFKPMPAAAPTPAAAPAADTSNAAANSGADPKAQVCGAFSTVSAAVFRYSHADPTGDPGVALAAAQEAIAANARLAMSGGSTYLLRNLSSAAPADLAVNIRSFAGSLDTIAMKLLAGTPEDNPDLVGLLQSADQSNKKITELCK